MRAASPTPPGGACLNEADMTPAAPSAPKPGSPDPETHGIPLDLLKWAVVALLILSGLDLRPVSAQEPADQGAATVAPAADRQ